ncbi:IS200/IS605 family transposase [Roseivirga pacifica]
MSNTYSQIHIQVVFAVQDRVSLITPTWKDRLYKYITTIIQNHGHKVLQINGMPDHIHILIGLRPTQALSILIKEVKQYSSKWINESGFVIGKFSWQSGYGAFSYSKAQAPMIVKYIQNQEEHHRETTFLEEYKDLLNDFEIDFQHEYLFKPIL